MANLKKGDYVTRNGKVGVIDNISGDGTVADVSWNGGGGASVPVSQLKLFNSQSFLNGRAKAEREISNRTDKFGEEITKGQSRGAGHIVHFHTADGYILEQDGPVYTLFHGTRMIASGTDRKKVVDSIPVGSKGGGIY